MAIYVYQTATGTLVSYIPDSITIAQAQATFASTNGMAGLADSKTLSNAGLSAIDSQPQLSATMSWSPVSKTVTPSAVVIPPPPPIATGSITISGSTYSVTLS